MALFARRRRLETRDSGFWQLPGGYGLALSAYQGGMYEQMMNAATWACVNVLVDALGRTPLDAVYYRNGARVPVEPPPTLLRRPSAIVRRDVWRTQLAYGMVTDGNAFGLVQGMTTRAYPSQIEWLDSSKVTQRQVVDGVAQVAIVPGGPPRRLWPAGDVFHIPGRMVPGGTPFGESPLAAAARSGRTSMAAEDFAQRFFTEDAHPSKVFLIDGQPDVETLERARANYERAMRPGSREPLFIPKSTDMKELQSDLNTTQFIELMRYEVEQVCRFFGVPPTMVFAAVSGQAVTYANATQNETSILKNTLDGYYVREEEALTEALPAPQVVKANRDVILRADVETRWRIHTMALAAKARTINEVRKIEDEEPFDDPIYDEPGVPAAAPVEPTIMLPSSQMPEGASDTGVANG